MLLQVQALPPFHPVVFFLGSTQVDALYECDFFAVSNFWVRVCDIHKFEKLDL